MAKRHDQHPATRRQIAEGAHGCGPLIMIQMLPNGGQKQTVKAALSGPQTVKMREPIIQPFDLLTFVERDTRLTQLIDGLHC